MVRYRAYYSTLVLRGLSFLFMVLCSLQCLLSFVQVPGLVRRLKQPGSRSQLPFLVSLSFISLSLSRRCVTQGTAMQVFLEWEVSRFAFCMNFRSRLRFANGLQGSPSPFKAPSVSSASFLKNLCASPRCFQVTDFVLPCLSTSKASCNS